MPKQKPDHDEYVDPADREKWAKLHPEDRFVFKHLSEFLVALAIGKKPPKDKDTFEALGEFLATALRVRRLEERVAELEARPELKHAGTWRKGTPYQERNCVTHGGSLWMCCAPTSTAKPGNSPHWRLIVKRGRVHDDLATQGQAS